MPRKEHTYHYIYKTTCKVTNKFYIGMHSTSNLEDGYIGSGKKLWNSINKWGRENHEFEILEYLPDRSSLKTKEEEIVNEGLLQDPMCMNLQLGGGGGFINEEHQRKCSEFGRKAFLEKLKDDTFKQKFFAAAFESSIIKPRGFIINRPSSKGRKHSQATKDKIGNSNSLLQKGDKNSQYGSCWITKSGENKKVKTENIQKFLLEGWTKGRKIK